MDPFEKTKADILADLGVVDYSPKGSVDHSIIPLINLVNSNKDLVTTSSCSGRVSVFVEGCKNGTVKVGGKGEGGHWLFTTHSAEDLVPGWRKGLDAYRTNEDIIIDDMNPKRYVLYKFEPFILHVKCRNHEAAKRLFSLALFCGFRESGIGSNENVAIRTSMRIDAPLGYLKGDRIHRFASDDYLAELDSLALELFAKNTERIQRLADHITGFTVPETKKVQSRQEKALQDRLKGLERQKNSEKKEVRANTDTETETEPELGNLFI